MADYVATGKEAQNDCSVKVSADSDLGAFEAAKGKLPIVSGLERIEADGSLTRILGLPFDDIRTVLETFEGREMERVEERRKRERKCGRRIAAILFVVAVVGCEFMCDVHHWQWDRQATTQPIVVPGKGR